MEEIDNSLTKLKSDEKTLTEAWDKEKNINDDIKKLKSKIDEEKFLLEQAENRYDLETAAKLRHGVIPELEKELKELMSVSKISY